ncbi:MAG: helix-turn-helix domain-containing protein [Candidatus Aminicenantes bacterium]|nr:helix-turn-helix domain-containing protein [Candidatus Aminicenantes bacterium]
MSDENRERDLEVLELGPQASLTEVKNAHLRLKRLYTGESALLSPIAQDLSEDKRLRILLEIEEAYQRLLASFRDEAQRPQGGGGPATAGASRQEKTSSAEELTFSGPVLKRVRESLGLPLHLIFHTTKIRVEQLEAIEEENFAKLPDEAYLKVHLMAYAGHLSLNPKKVVQDYLKRYAVWKKVHRFS